jgi:hypothetical protein
VHTEEEIKESVCKFIGKMTDGLNCKRIENTQFSLCLSATTIEYDCNEFEVLNLCASLTKLQGVAKSPVWFAKRVYLSKPAQNIIKTWFSREKPAEMSSKPGFC